MDHHFIRLWQYFPTKFLIGVINEKLTMNLFNLSSRYLTAKNNSMSMIVDEAIIKLKVENKTCVTLLINFVDCQV